MSRLAALAQLFFSETDPRCRRPASGRPPLKSKFGRTSSKPSTPPPSWLRTRTPATSLRLPFRRIPKIASCRRRKFPNENLRSSAAKTAPKRAIQPMNSIRLIQRSPKARPEYPRPMAGRPTTSRVATERRRLGIDLTLETETTDGGQWIVSGQDPQRTRDGQEAHLLFELGAHAAPHLSQDDQGAPHLSQDVHEAPHLSQDDQEAPHLHRGAQEVLHLVHDDQ